jgi:hypothetical protein
MQAQELDLQGTAAPEPAPAARPVVLNTPHARDMLRKRYAPPEWAFMEEVAPATGGGTRYADGIAVNLWQSRGHAVHGFEIKVSRSDWLRELKDPAKAEPLYRYCDMWWIVAPRGIVKDGELPPTWGLLEVREAGLVQIVAAPRLQPQPIGRAFFASLMRRGFEQLDRMAELKVLQARAEVEKRVREATEQRVRDSSRELRELKEQLAKVEAETGLTFNRYSGPPVSVIKLAQKLQALDGYRGDGSLARLSHIAGELERAAATVRDAVQAAGLAEDPGKDGAA